jgi:hypothetical protein
MMAVLINTPNLHTFLLQEHLGVQAVFLDPLLRPNSRTLLNHLACSIYPTDVEVLPLLNQFERLTSLNLMFEEKETIFSDDLLNNGLEPLRLPLLESFTLQDPKGSHPLGLNFTNKLSGVKAVMQYIGRSFFHQHCQISIYARTCTEEAFILLNPLFASHASTRIVLTLGDNKVSSQSLIFSRAQSVDITDVLPPALFEAPRLPPMITMTIKDSATLVTFWRILDTLVVSPHHHRSRLHVGESIRGSSFSWEPCTDSMLEAYRSLPSKAEFTGNLLRYVIQLRSKGIEMIDGDGRAFRDCFPDLPGQV